MIIVYTPVVTTMFQLIHSTAFFRKIGTGYFFTSQSEQTRRLWPTENNIDHILEVDCRRDQLKHCGNIKTNRKNDINGLNLWIEQIFKFKKRKITYHTCTNICVYVLVLCILDVCKIFSQKKKICLVFKIDCLELLHISLSHTNPQSLKKKIGQHKGKPNELHVWSESWKNCLSGGHCIHAQENYFKADSINNRFFLIV